jgi:spermidine synthase
MDLWVTEMWTPIMALSCKTRKTIHHEKSEYQEIAVIDTEQFGRMLLLDGVIQTTVEDEFIYHEMIAHVPLFAHKNPKKVLVVGGGDGGTIREIVKHPTVEKAVLVEIDDRVVEVSKEYLPEISCALDHEKVEVVIGDGIKYVKEKKNEFDVIIIDSTDPVGPAEGLFSADFYRSVHECLKEDGIMVAQAESPFFDRDFLKKILSNIGSSFALTRLYTGFVPTYPGGYWGFALGSKKYDPVEIDPSRADGIETRFYSPEIHKASFVLPRYVSWYLSER